jgi:hypothetical protein
MQRVAIFQFKRGQKLALLLIAILSITVLSLFVYNNRAHADATSTYSTETTSGIETKIKALNYYGDLVACTSSNVNGGAWKTTVSGDDIDKGPRWWTNSNMGIAVDLGQYIDSWGDKNGQTECNGESDSQPGWVADMFTVFGVSITDNRAGLESLGYSCSQSGDQYNCTNNSINSQTSKKGIVYQMLHGPYLNGVNPLNTQPDEKAMMYYLALNALTTNSACNAQPGGSSNLVTVSQVQPDGTIKKGNWAVENDGGPSRQVDAGAPIPYITRYPSTCSDMAADTVEYAADYVSWSGASACATSFPSMANDPLQLHSCAEGRSNPTNYALCVAGTLSDDASENYAAKNACFLGQGLPQDATGQSSGMLCYDTLRYTDTSDLTACINGSLNLSSTTYCDDTYPAPQAISPGKPIPVDSNATLRTACKTGQKLQVSGGGVPQDGTLKDTAAAGSGGTSCGVDGIGWIVCPVISFMGDLLSSAFSGLADNFLSTDVSLFSTSSGTYTAWGVFRNFANIAFVIAFLIIIFSQLTGVGVTNYGVKKLLPRIVIAAILVNLSYFICQVAVDLSNILGYGLKSVFDSIAVTAKVPTSTDASANGFGIAAIIVAVIATATVAYFALSILIPILLGALIGVLMVVLMLIARKAIIILLIVLSPLAFVAFLLPNTQPLFTRWRKAFMALLLLFPIISVVFGMSSLASQIVLGTGTTSGDSSQVILQIMSVGIASLPFFLVPVLLKGSLNGIGAVGGKLTAFANKAGGNLGKAGAKGFGNTALARGRAIRQQSRANYRNEKFATSIGKGGARSFFARGANVTGAQKYANLALERSAVNSSLDAENKELEAAKGVMVQTNMSGQQRHELATKGKVVVTDADGKTRTLSGDVMQKAAIQEVFRAGSYDEQQSVLRQSHNADPKTGGLGKFKQTIANSVVSNGMAAKDPALAGKRIDEISQGNFDYDNAVRTAANEGKYTPEALAGMNDDARANAIRVANAQAAAGDGSTLLALRRGAAGITAEMRGKMSTSTAAEQQFRELS